MQLGIHNLYLQQTGDISTTCTKYAHPQLHSYTLFMCVHISGSHVLQVGVIPFSFEQIEKYDQY